jgi:hypothetical protein
MRFYLIFVSVVVGGGCTADSAADDYDDAIARAEYQFGDETFEDVGDTSECTEDCSGHEAGFDWARENGLSDPSECGGNSDSFIEGCEAYTTALQDAAADGGDDYEADY